MFEIRQRDLDPAMGGIGWTEGCPTCEGASRYGWREKKGHHSAACRVRVEAHLNSSESGKARLELAKKRMDRWQDE